MKTYRVYLQSARLDDNGEPVMKIETNMQGEHSGEVFDRATKDYPRFVVFDVVEVPDA